MTHKELQSLDDKQLMEELNKSKKHLDAISFDHVQGNLKDTSQLSKSRKYIAHIKSAMNMRKNGVKQAKAPQETKEKKGK